VGPDPLLGTASFIRTGRGVFSRPSSFSVLRFSFCRAPNTSPSSRFASEDKGKTSLYLLSLQRLSGLNGRSPLFFLSSCSDQPLESLPLFFILGRFRRSCGMIVGLCHGLKLRSKWSMGCLSGKIEHSFVSSHS
jgi:hypothetical protein